MINNLHVVVAILIEDLSLLDTLRGMGVDYAQGFAVGRPLESTQIFEGMKPEADVFLI